MKYYQLMYDYERYGEINCLVSKDMFGIDKYDINSGKIFSKWSDFTFYYNPDDNERFIDYQPNDLGWFTISLKFKEIIEKLNYKGVEFLPISIKNEKNNSVNNDYYIVNIFNNIEGAMDYENTKYIGPKPSVKYLQEEQIHVYIKSYALKEEKINGYDIFRINEKWGPPIFVSENFKKSVIKNNITGCDFGKVIIV